eukprot:768420-Hanusia_phi.AAC.6
MLVDTGSFLTEVGKGGAGGVVVMLSLVICVGVIRSFPSLPRLRACVPGPNASTKFVTRRGGEEEERRGGEEAGEEGRLGCASLHVDSTLTVPLLLSIVDLIPREQSGHDERVQRPEDTHEP